MRTALITTAAGRGEHLRRQRDGEATLTRSPDVRVIVAMEPSEAAGLRALHGPGTQVVVLDGPSSALPLARARNLGAEAALADGAELLVFLDADCIPGPGLLERYEAAAATHPATLLCGPVAYLRRPPPGGYDLGGLAAAGSPPASRPVPDDGEVLADGDHRLFWSLSFAVAAGAWRRIGGFCERYTGYGGEDTDFAQLARELGVGLCWVGGAWAHHQHHAVDDPPTGHLDDILRNAAIFHERWGWWPMGGWLDAFAELGLARLDPGRGRWERTRPAA